MGSVGVDPTTFFLILGLVLMGLELVIPGLVVIFLGAAAVLTAGGLWLGLIGSWVGAFTCWFVASIGLVLSLRSVFTRFLPGTVTKQLTDEDLDAFGEEAEVVEEVTPVAGRIRFRGTTWDAQTVGEVLPAGTRVRIVTRENLSWIVEPIKGWASLDRSKALGRMEDRARKEGEA